MSRFVRLPQSVPRRRWDNIQDGDKIAENVDTRLFAAYSEDPAEPLSNSLDYVTKVCHHNVGMHCTLNFLITVKAIPPVDLTVFELIKSRASSVLKNYNKIKATARYIQQARNFAYVLSIDDWWVRNFMMKGGLCVQNDNEYMVTKDVVAGQDEGEPCNDEGEQYGAVDSKSQISVATLVRAAHRVRICCTEEIALFAWQMMLSTGVVSHSIISFIAKVYLHYLRHVSNAQGKLVSPVEISKSMLSFCKPEASHNISMQLCNTNEHRELLTLKPVDFDNFTFVYHCVENVETDVTETMVLNDFCKLIESHNEEYAVMDTKYSSSQIYEALYKLIHDKNISYSIRGRSL